MDRQMDSLWAPEMGGWTNWRTDEWTDGLWAFAMEEGWMGRQTGILDTRGGRMEGRADRGTDRQMDSLSLGTGEQRWERCGYRGWEDGGSLAARGWERGGSEHGRMEGTPSARAEGTGPPGPASRCPSPFPPRVRCRLRRRLLLSWGRDGGARCQCRFRCHSRCRPPPCGPPRPAARDAARRLRAVGPRAAALRYRYRPGPEPLSSAPAAPGKRRAAPLPGPPLPPVSPGPRSSVGGRAGPVTFSRCRYREEMGGLGVGVGGVSP